jgi:hypothetical protein
MFQIKSDTIKTDSLKLDTLIGDRISEPIRIQILESKDTTDWNVWFLLLGVLSLIAAVAIPFIQKKYEERKTKYGFHLYIKKRLGVVWNLLTYDKFEYKQPTTAESMDDLQLTFDTLIFRFEKDFQKNKETSHPLFAFGILFNLQRLLITVYRVQQSLSTIDLNNLGEKTLEYGDKLSKKEHLKLTGIYMLIEHYISITSHHDKFDSLQAIKRQVKDKRWTGLIVENTVLQNQGLILKDLQYLRDNEISINEILNVNKLLIQELKSYFDFDKLDKKRKNRAV